MQKRSPATYQSREFLEGFVHSSKDRDIPDIRVDEEENSGDDTRIENGECAPTYAGGFLRLSTSHHLRWDTVRRTNQVDDLPGLLGAALAHLPIHIRCDFEWYTGSQQGVRCLLENLRAERHFTVEPLRCEFTNLR